MRPVSNPKSRICLSLSQNGLVAYGNTEALSDLRDQLAWIVKSDPKDHFECHVIMTLESDETRFEGKKPRNAWVKASDDINMSLIEGSEENYGFELTFMLVEEKDLDDLQS
jgi:hypothetical protein